jgi:hypothetical protein
MSTLACLQSARIALNKVRLLHDPERSNNQLTTPGASSTVPCTHMKNGQQQSLAYVTAVSNQVADALGKVAVITGYVSSHFVQLSAAANTAVRLTSAPLPVAVLGATARATVICCSCSCVWCHWAPSQQKAAHCRSVLCYCAMVQGSSKSKSLTTMSPALPKLPALPRFNSDICESTVCHISSSEAPAVLS